MPTSLSFECWPIPEPAAVDPVEKQTWASLRIFVEQRCVTRFLDRRTGREAEEIFVPLFPIIQWLIGNWWSLFYEPCPTERPPKETDYWFAQQRRWVFRHCLRSAESGLFLPYLQIYGNGPGVSVFLANDDRYRATSMPGYFLNSGTSELDSSDVMTGARALVSKVLGWCDGLDDARVHQLRADWTAITNAGDDETEFCRASGRLGLDPYNIASWDADVLDFISNRISGRIKEPIVEDFLESKPSHMRELWQWVSNTEEAFNLRSRVAPQLSSPEAVRKAKDQGYFFARWLRQAAKLNTDEPISDIGVLARAVGAEPVRFEEHNHLPDKVILATVGWQNAKPMVVGPVPQRSDSKRFLEARGLYQLLTGCQQGPRLVTNAHTWDQQAARAFAAELLAPQQALASYVSPEMDSDELGDKQEELANHYEVSSEVIRLQLQNYGI